jgi:hypothetical protein
MKDANISLDSIPQLGELYRLFSGGKHLNRVAAPALWAELEREQGSYQRLFRALGFELRMDGRGFAWFQTNEGSASSSKVTRQLALLFMLLFEYQADAGKSLLRFTDWRIDKTLLTEVNAKYQELLTAEQLDTEALSNLLVTAERYGFAFSENGFWRLLPAVCRYLDHFEELAEHRDDEIHSWLAVDQEDA